MGWKIALKSPSYMGRNFKLDQAQDVKTNTAHISGSAHYTLGLDTDMRSII